MSTGDAVCTGWLVKSPPERKLQRYWPRQGHGEPQGSGRAKCSRSQSPVCRRGRSTESEIARRASVAAVPCSGADPSGSCLWVSAALDSC
ncbi:Hypothetical predicted protein [Marmota monax]|uniref:Uncharacterized protein n=1 Tax=Marmota monax TaxID=9995 RepID=A0A5E4B1T9_MARMO|nr:hypothetical protein GHT09_012589 [Marmota monax]VTJ63110.1 Hypothetical predicted protein [Marmota monax]